MEDYQDDIGEFYQFYNQEFVPNMKHFLQTISCVTIKGTGAGAGTGTDTKDIKTLSSTPSSTEKNVHKKVGKTTCLGSPKWKELSPFTQVLYRAPTCPSDPASAVLVHRRVSDLACTEGKHAHVHRRIERPHKRLNFGHDPVDDNEAKRIRSSAARRRLNSASPTPF